MDLPEDPLPADGQDGVWVDANRDNLATLGLAIKQVGLNITEAADMRDVADAKVYCYVMEQFLLLQRCLDNNGPQLMVAALMAEARGE